MIDSTRQQSTGITHPVSLIMLCRTSFTDARFLLPYARVPPYHRTVGDIVSLSRDSDWGSEEREESLLRDTGNR